MGLPGTEWYKMMHQHGTWYTAGTQYSLVLTAWNPRGGGTVGAIHPTWAQVLALSATSSMPLGKKHHLCTPVPSSVKWKEFYLPLMGAVRMK